ncbi:MAG: tetratricopeptide repeat protein [Candidatus Zixiibacteriota bacterium]|nr:MAG: tetratricopeptide repeat protein [candidate division Zixibacteria bacterium]
MSRSAFWLFLSLLTCATAITVAATPQDDFAAGNELYESKEFGQAIQKYESILSQGLQSAPLYYNLGNAYFKSGDLGRAILNYHRAARLDPGNSDIAENLSFASGFTSVQMEGVKLNPVRTFLQMLVAPYHLDSLAWLSSALFVLLIALLAVRFGVGMRSAWLKGTVVSTLTLFVISSFFTTYKYRHEYLTERAVILAEDCQVRTGPSEQSDIELRGAPGLVVEVLAESGDYYSVLFENKRRGWVQKNLVDII